MVLRVGYIREHFSSPLLQFADADAGKTFELVECPSGTGQIISRFANNEIDVAIALTDALLAGISKGQTSYKVVGSYVTTPLNWAVITGKDSQYNSIPELKGSILGISRAGSGSETMASVLALQEDWTENVQTRINDNITGLVASVNDGTTSAFLWEWFTTKPWLDRGEVRFIGSVPTPWPSWTIAAHSESTRAPPSEVATFLDGLTSYIRAFDSKESRDSKNVPFIVERFGYKEEDVEAWLKTVKFTTDAAVVREAVIRDTISVLRRAGVVSPTQSLSASEYVHEKIAKVLSIQSDVSTANTQ